MSDKVKLTYGGAVNAALARCLEQYPETILYGEDVALPGGVFGVTRGLQKAFGERVFDTPISETAMLGAAVGAAMMGRRPIVEIMWMDFALVAFDQIVNQAANVRYVSEGRLSAPLTIRTQQGNAPGACAQHSQNLEALLLHVPGIRVAMPVSAQDAHDVLIAAVACDDPVVVIENRTLYPGAKAEVQLNQPPQPIGGHRRRRRGDDVTVVTWGAISASVQAAADLVAAEGIGADVIEAVWLNPFDTEAVQDSVRRTGRLLVVHEANVTGGFGAEVVARVVEAGVPLKAPPRRLGAQDTRIPAAVALAQAVLPQTAQIADALRALVKG
ncbi:alpha-ketoacid dehydrogenase subunit beta [Kineosporia babensis]|uniref:Alpha-ketoacid dehydrogenase subunit beta n=1 Tax=Kineosporia babensis TaxID=499548 RepID=A0A9X1NIW5_9ACTN|nr:transketolase C-terminal domain-containing protein [Kineosporia babensis]MCD5314639.1 alpha-ketoacid dehydrogenase subunit beta [Kineosporia babensis]